MLIQLSNLLLAGKLSSQPCLTFVILAHLVLQTNSFSQNQNQFLENLDFLLDISSSPTV